MHHKIQPNWQTGRCCLAGGSKGQCRKSKNFLSLLMPMKVDQYIFFPETCFASTISEPEFTVWFINVKTSQPLFDLFAFSMGNIRLLIICFSLVFTAFNPGGSKPWKSTSQNAGCRRASLAGTQQIGCHKTSFTVKMTLSQQFLSSLLSKQIVATAESPVTESEDCHRSRGT